MPVLTVFAGPNGAGKSSIIRRVDFAGRSNLLEADAIAARIQTSDPWLAQIAAGREVLHRTQVYMRAGDDFAIETTLAGIWVARTMKQAIARGFFVRLVYIGLDSPEKCIQRVRERVAQGGHSVPDKDVRRRYPRSLSNVARVLKAVNEAVFYDNSGPEPRLVLEVRSGKPVSRTSEMPEWARHFAEEL